MLLCVLRLSSLVAMVRLVNAHRHPSSIVHNSPHTTSCES